MAKLLPLLCLLDLSSSATRYLATALPNPVVMVIVLGALALAPFVLIMLTSFVKISVVLAILRNALGTQSVPPNQVITGLAFILSMFIMTPVVRNMYHEAGAIANTRDIFSEASIKNLFDAADKGKEPLRRFLARHAHDADRMLFVELARRLEESPNQGGTGTPSPTPPMTKSTPVPASTSESVVGKADILPTPQKTPDQHEAKGEDNTGDRPGKDDFQVLIPAFVTSELQEAFRIGFLVFLPFIIIDMVVANILLAMGMSMLSPSVVSLPFKLLLFVLVNGWFLIVRNLVLSYV
jgi:type III secretion protein R